MHQWLQFSFLVFFLPCSSHGKHLLSAQVVTIQMVQQVFQGNESLRIDQTSSNGSNVLSFNSLQLSNKNGWYSGILNQCFKLLSNVLMSLVTVIQLRISYCSSNSSQRVFPGCGNQLPRLIFHHWLSKPLSLKPIISKPAKFEQKAVQQ